MTLEEERDYFRDQAETAQSILGFVLAVLERPVFIDEETITKINDEGFPGQLYVDVTDVGVEVGLRDE